MMNPVSEPIVKDLVLVGGGHSHALALRMLGMQPLSGVRITLLTEASDTPYSGMLPGHIAGFYGHDECHIDLRPLAQFAQAQLYLDRVVGLDLPNKRVICAHRPPVAFDVVSIDIGSTPTIPDIARAVESSIPVKPIRRFLEHWDQLIEQVSENPEQPICIGIIGGGAGGVELSLAVQRHLHKVLRRSQQATENLTLHLFQRGTVLMPGYSRWVGDRFHKILTQRGIHLHLGETVVEVQAHQVKCESGLTVACDHTFWVTQAAAPNWVKASSLATDAQGFIGVDENLRSLSHPFVFAAGDIATVKNHPRPKAGVFAVRQGKPLFENLRRTLLGHPLKPYIPQKRYLSLIGTSEDSDSNQHNRAIASWGSLGYEAPWLWQLKDAIDRRFMERFSQLPEMTHQPATGVADPLVPEPNSKIQNLMRCGGCGAKVGSSVLERVLQRIQQEYPQPSDRADILIGLDAPDDAAVLQIPADCVLVQTIDYFRSLINDPFVFGQISANHCLSDIFAMGAMPQSALAIATVPYALEAKVEETLYQLLAGALKVLHQAGAALIGGHTTEGAELAFGLTCNGLAERDRLLRKTGMQPGQALILTKALGTGALFAADMQRQAKGRWIDAAVESMLQSNQAAAECLMQHQASACTDITGFGLLGHLAEMTQASQVAVELKLEAIPLLAGARTVVEQGIVSSLQPQNVRAALKVQNWSKVSDRPEATLLFDPQTSGGLLAAVPAERASDCISALQSLGYQQSRPIGGVLSSISSPEPITIEL
ncbi:selenide, water dikinase SelD [Trichocoleus sp. FACHB-591]|uniref:selenide, water dikinase SelD n=1 Tax=Trichocoleus sp. FACHB-591 TaxID=2692872 RepID=UPI001F555FD8|nr:selenide, water dikinase SelD [Trichocoleus sp. FACHB-591]